MGNNVKIKHVFTGDDAEDMAAKARVLYHERLGNPFPKKKQQSANVDTTDDGVGVDHAEEGIAVPPKKKQKRKHGGGASRPSQVHKKEEALKLSVSQACSNAESVLAEFEAHSTNVQLIAQFAAQFHK